MRAIHEEIPSSASAQRPSPYISLPSQMMRGIHCTPRSARCPTSVPSDAAAPHRSHEMLLDLYLSPLMLPLFLLCTYGCMLASFTWLLYIESAGWCDIVQDDGTIVVADPCTQVRRKREPPHTEKRLRRYHAEQERA